jgi:hypothetical protein
MYRADIRSKNLLSGFGSAAIHQFMLSKCLILIVVWPPLSCVATPIGQHAAAFVLLGSVG